MTMLLLVGTDAALLEGLAQSLSALGQVPRVASSLAEARDLAAITAPLVAVVDRALAATELGQLLGLTVAPGGALVLYGGQPAPRTALPPALQRVVLADLTLPLERHRLVALIQHVRERAHATGKRRQTPTGQAEVEG